MLAGLPTELLNQIVAHCPPSSVGSLSQTSHALHNFVEKEGWRTFTQTSFTSLNPPPYWRDAAWSLTTLSRNWQRRAFLATFVEPAGDISTLPSGQALKKWRRPGGQTMGFQPAVDSYEQYIGTRWTDRREVLAWSAGAELVVRVKTRDASTEEACRLATPQEQRDLFETNGTRVQWWTYKPLSSVEGRDDITSVKILRKPGGFHRQCDKPDRTEQIIIGTARGDLQLLEIPSNSQGGVIKTYFVTNGIPVRSTSLSPDSQHLVANLSDSKLAIYRAEPDQFKVAPVSEINAIPHGKRGCRIWSTRFLDAKHLAVGLGPSVEPVNIFEVRPEGLVEEPNRKIGLSGNADSLEPVKASSIYPIEPLLDGNGGPNGNSFLSGGYDGVVRLHDLRSPSPFETTYNDPTDDAAVYSLLSRGMDRVVAGTSRHGLLKVYDLRMTGGSTYNYAGMTNGSNEAEDSTAISSDWNIFINPRDRYANSSWRGPNSWMRRSAEGSVYSLSSPSPSSPFIFAGVENAVVEFNFSSVLDSHPDPIFLGSPGSRNQMPSYLRNKQDVLNLAMYSQGTDGARGAMQLRSQRSVKETLGRVRNPVGLDERWMEIQ